MARHEMLGDQIRSIALEGLLTVEAEVKTVGLLTGNRQDSTLTLVNEIIQEHLQEVNMMVRERRRSRGELT